MAINKHNRLTRAGAIALADYLRANEERINRERLATGLIAAQASNSLGVRVTNSNLKGVASDIGFALPSQAVYGGSRNVSSKQNRAAITALATELTRLSTALGHESSREIVSLAREGGGFDES